VPCEQGQSRAEGEVVDDHAVGSHVVDDALHGACRLHRVPQQVVLARGCLEGERLNESAARGVEEAAEGVILARRLVLRLDDAGIRTAPEL
jgi:hypothetical protein